MQLEVLKSKIHRASVTSSSLNYEGSLTIDSALMEKVGLMPYEKILCGNIRNGERFETYVIPGQPGSGAIILNGATAHRGQVGDLLTIMNFALIEETEAKSWKPRVIVLGEKNIPVKERASASLARGE